MRSVRALIAPRQHGRQLEIWGCAIVEVDTGAATHTVARRRSIAEEIDLEVLVISRGGIVGKKRGSCEREERQCDGKNGSRQLAEGFAHRMRLYEPSRTGIMTPAENKW